MTPRAEAPAELLTTAQAAAYLTVSQSAVRAWRVRGGGPPWVKVGRAVRYQRRDLLAWLEAQRCVAERPW